MRLLTLVLAFVFALGLTACETDTTRTTATDPATTTTDPMVTPGTTVDGMAAGATTAETNRALDNGVVQMSAQNALSNIDGWINRLEGADFAQRDQIVGGLRDLRGALQESPIDGARVSGLLSDLGTWTTQAGTDANNADVQRMGQLLTQNSERLRTGTTGATAPAGGAAPGVGTPGGTAPRN